MNPQERLSYMKAMGIPVWAARSSSMYDRIESEDVPTPETEAADVQQNQQRSSASSLINSLDDVKQVPTKPRQIPTQSTETVTATIYSKSSINDLSWDELQAAVQACQHCDFHKFRTHTVFGSGNINADWMLIGEAPDMQEDSEGLPFLGRAGTLLDNILAAIDLNREAVYLANILKCRPPNDRSGHKDEVANCLSYLYRQIAIVKPKVILVVGRVAAQQLLQTKEKIGNLRGKPHYLGKSKIPVIVTYHPRYLLRQASKKRQVWQDIKLARSIVQA